MRNLRIISSHLSRGLRSIQSHPIQSRRSYSSQSENVSKIVTELSNLTLLETMDLTELLRKKLGVSDMPVMAAMAFPGSGGGGGPGAAAAGKGEEKKKAEAKTAFDVMLQGFESASKIKVIKEVRSVTDLGLKEAKDLVEKAPTLLKKGVSKEEAEKIIEKLKAVGAKVDME
ncbi:50S ribosomal protein L7/L12 [Brassica rapa]|uniref:Ribosomal protein L7/L12 C-terminal domain-containing protein n=1 Tax=Brassica campestris TaxID=3711 RepID=M4DMM5_BRACM|nr:50S ribosomal protein L7/L12 [Brassica rapa]XP_033143487.1 50S ribosomal protein L7/L12 [Brassica rapa]